MAPGTVYVALFYFDINGDVTVQRYRTTDDGGHWTALAPTPGTPELHSWHLLLAVDPRDGSHVFANDAYELYESVDSGQTWTLAEKIGDDWVNMTFDADNNGVVTADRNVYTYDLSTKTWTAKQGNLQVTQHYDITLDQNNLDSAYGIAQDHTSAMKFSGSILWDRLAGGETGKVLIDPNDPNRLYVSNPLNPPSLVRRSEDGGANWTTILVDNNFKPEDYGLAYSVQKSFVMDPQNPDRLLIGLTTVFECADATAASPSWGAISGVLSPSASVSGQYITALAIAPSDGQTIYAATQDGHVWITTNNGGQWDQNDTDLFIPGTGKVVDMRIDPGNPKRVFAASSGWAGQNIWSLDPATNTWVTITGDMPNNLAVCSICVDWKSNALFVGTQRSVYWSTDLGVHWSIFGKFLPRTQVNDLQTVPASDVLAAATFGRGVFEILLRETDGVASEPPPEEAAEEARPADLRPARWSDVYFHVSELTMLPGREPGEPLVRRRRRTRSPHRG
jgi:hypothetical protein